MKKLQKPIAILGLVALLLLTVSCAAGNKRFDEKPAGFWAGLWHGIIIVITFVISLFTDTVDMYEVNNSGGWYNFGFLLGAIIALGGSGGGVCKKRRKKGPREKDWEEICSKVEEKVRKGIKDWVEEPEKEGVEESEEKKKEWEEIGKKVEEKIKRELRKWAEK